MSKIKVTVNSISQAIAVIDLKNDTNYLSIVEKENSTVASSEVSFSQDAISIQFLQK